MPERIYIEKEVAQQPLTRQVLERCPDVPFEQVERARELILAGRDRTPPDFNGKKNLLLCANRGRFLEPCPGTKAPYLCCCYTILNIGTGCPLDCSYCVLQAYLNNPFVTLYANLQDLTAEFQACSWLGMPGAVRLGTGEYMDSLALEHLTDFTLRIQPVLKKRKELRLELKTKTVNIENLIRHDFQKELIVSWSLNAPAVALREELGAAAVSDRIEAARRLADRGYRVGFHFDPLVYHPGWEQGYRQVVEELAARVPADAIAWISIGSLRYMPRLKTVAQSRFPDTRIFTQELIPGIDGKMRYLQEIRIEIYKELTRWLKKCYPAVFLYYCMENPAVWQRTLGFAPKSNAELKRLLDDRLKRA